MSNTGSKKRIIDTMRKELEDNEHLRQFLMDIFNWESSTKGSYHYKDRSKALIKMYSREQVVENENL